MAALNPANHVPTGLVPYYRRYDLPWAPSEETERRFVVILRNLAIVFTIIALIMPFCREPCASPTQIHCRSVWCSW